MIEVDPQRVIHRLVQRIGELEMEVAKYAAAVDQMEIEKTEQQQQQSGDDLEGRKSAAEQKTG